MSHEEPKYESSWERCRRDDVDEIQFIVSDSDMKRVLAFPEGDDWRLPGFFPESAYYANSALVIKLAKEIIGFSFLFTVLRCVWHRQKEFMRENCDSTVMRSVVVLECQEEPVTIPEGSHWVGIGHVTIIHSEDEAQSIIKRELDDMSKGVVPELRVPWGRLGWFAETSIWMRDVLSAQGVILTERIQQIRSSAWGTVLQGQAESGEYYYLKCTPVFSNEAAVTEALSAIAPSYVAKPIAIDKKRKLMISADHGVILSSFFGENRVSDVPKMLRDFSLLQKATMKNVDMLEKAGLQVYSPTWLVEHVDFLLDHEELASYADTPVLKKLKKSREDLRNALNDMGNTGVPLALVHGDLDGANVYRTDSSGPFGFFDWDCSYISHPFFDISAWNDDTAAGYLKEMAEFQTSPTKEVRAITMKVRYFVKSFHLLREICHMEECSKLEARDSLYRELELTAMSVLKFGTI